MFVWLFQLTGFMITKMFPQVESLAKHVCEVDELHGEYMIVLAKFLRYFESTVSKIQASQFQWKLRMLLYNPNT